MKNILINKVFLIGLIIIFNSGCKKDLLNPVPISSISDKSAFSTPDRIKNLLNGLYDGLKSGNFLGSRAIIYHDIRGEEFLNELNNAVTGLQTWNHTVNSNTTEVNTLWGQCYSVINSCNIFINGVEANKSVLNNETLAANYIAEAKFVRALSYYYLLVTYAKPFADNSGNNNGVILRLKPEIDGTSNDLERSSVANCYAQIIKDLNEAETSLPLTYSIANDNYYRAHKNTAIALKTRVYLSMGKYADVVTEAAKIVSSVAPFKASTGVAHELSAMVADAFKNPGSKENIFSLPFTDGDSPGTQNGLAHYWTAAPKGGGEYSLNPGGILGDTTNFTVADARRGLMLKSGTKWYLNKFPNGPGAAQTDPAPIIRYAEVLLNYAEAQARASAGVDSKAVALIEALHKRSDNGFVMPTFANQDELISFILKERRIELLGEGLRALDCQRLLIPIPGKLNVAAQLPTSAGYFWPIPSSELATNTKCVP